VQVVDEIAKRQAINRCLGQCYESDKPLVVLVEQLSALREAGWGELEVRQVETSVLKLLVGLMSDHFENPDDTTVD